MLAVVRMAVNQVRTYSKTMFIFLHNAPGVSWAGLGWAVCVGMPVARSLLGPAVFLVEVGKAH